MVVARLARRTLGADLPDAAVLERLGMVDDAGLAGLAGLWVALAALAGGPPVRDEAALPAVAAQVVAGGIPAAAWLAGTSAALAELAEGLPGRRTTRVARALDDLRAHEAPWQPGVPGDPAQVEAALRACLELARAVRSRTGLGPSAWLRVRAVAAAQAVVGQLDGALDRDTAVDLLADLLEQDVEGPDLLDALVCATSQVLLQVDPSELPEVRQAQVDELLQQVPAGPRAARWVLAACLREAHGHDSSAPDLAPFLAAEPSPDLDRAAARTGVRGLLEAGIVSLQTLVRVLGPELGLPAEHALALVLPAALVEHDLLRLPDEQA